MQTTATDVRQAALLEFASAGYLGTSIQAVADRAGVSKASVLYHFASKEALLDEVLSPALAELEELWPHTAQLAGKPEARTAFVEEFVDFLMRNRLAAQIFITQSGALVELPIMGRAQVLIAQIADATSQQSVDDQVRFAVALGGAAYLLAQLSQFKEGIELDDNALRTSLISVIGELLAPVFAV